MFINSSYTYMIFPYLSREVIILNYLKNNILYCTLENKKGQVDKESIHNLQSCEFESYCWCEGLVNRWSVSVYFCKYP